MWAYEWEISKKVTTKANLSEYLGRGELQDNKEEEPVVTVLLVSSASLLFRLEQEVHRGR